MEEAEGDILVFLTGQDEIESMERLLKDRLGQLPPSSRAGLKLSVVSIYASMPPDQQMKVTLNFNFLDPALVQSFVPKFCMLLDRCLSQRLRGTERLSWQQILRKHRSRLAVYGTLGMRWQCLSLFMN